jgi:hypothetical protein
LANGLSCAIRQQQATVVSEHGVPERRFNADARCAAGEHQIPNAKAPEDDV